MRQESCVTSETAAPVLSAGQGPIKQAAGECAGPFCISCPPTGRPQRPSWGLGTGGRGNFLLPAELEESWVHLCLRGSR